MQEPTSGAAAGSAAGFLFQPERALLHLAKGGERVGIETLDDVARIGPGDAVLLEQDKHSLTGRNPYSDRNPDLWRTLALWVSAVIEQGLPADGLELHLVTNAEVGPGLARAMSEAGEAAAIEACLRRLATLAAGLAEDGDASADFVQNADPAVLRTIVACTRLVDGPGTHGQALRDDVARHLHIPDDIDAREVIQALLGWIHDTCMELWRGGRPAWIERKAFKTRLARVISTLVSNHLIERTVDALPVSASDRDQLRQHVFVEQVRILSFSPEVADDYILEAVNDFIRCVAERTRLLEDGRITGDDLVDFENRLYERWQMQSRRHWATLRRDVEGAACESGQALYQQSIEHRESLAGIPTQQYYLTRGHLHRIADQLRLGWHPDYRTLLAHHAHKQSDD